jgi:hypothetical protein
MTNHDLVEALFAHNAAMDEAIADYQNNQVLHTLLCNCPRCQAIKRWHSLPWHQKLKARVFAGIRGNDR